MTNPKAKAAAKKEAPDPFDKLNPTGVRMSTVPERMLFTVLEFKVKAGAPVKLTFENPDAILHATKMLKQNQSETLRFRAPKQPGKHPCICSFPGHYLVMRGVMVVA